MGWGVVDSFTEQLQARERIFSQPPAAVIFLTQQGDLFEVRRRIHLSV